MGEAGISHYREVIRTPCENPTLKTNRFVYSLITDEYSEDETKIFNDSIAINVSFDTKNGFIFLDTLIKKKWITDSH